MHVCSPGADEDKPTPGGAGRARPPRLAARGPAPAAERAGRLASQPQQAQQPPAGRRRRRPPAAAAGPRAGRRRRRSARRRRRRRRAGRRDHREVHRHAQQLGAGGVAGLEGHVVVTLGVVGGRGTAAASTPEPRVRNECNATCVPSANEQALLKPTTDTETAQPTTWAQPTTKARAPRAGHNRTGGAMGGSSWTYFITSGPGAMGHAVLAHRSSLPE
jgi:hypothetical protein